MSLKYVDETSLQENILKTKQHVESVRSALDSAKQSVIEYATIPSPSEDMLGLFIIYTGATNSTYTHGYVYECVSDGGNPATYTWEQRNVQDGAVVDGVTIVKDASTDEISAVTATNSTKGIVKGSADVSIDADGAMTVKDRVKEVNALPTASVDLLDECYLLRSVQTGYDLGKIYQCQAVEVVPEGTENPSEEGWYELDGTTYELSADTSVDAGKTYYEIKWVSISSANLEAGRGITIEGSVINANTNTFTGTQAEWDELSTEEKKEYDIANFTDDGETGDITDVVESGNHNPVESDAVFDSEQTIFEVMGEMGAKNLLPYPYFEYRSTINGVTCVINSDGSVTFNGTATNKIYFNCTFTEKIVDFGNVSFDSKTTSNAAYIATLENGSNDVYLSYNAINKITSININSGTVCNNLTVYPMIRLASDTDSTYQPYAPTNKVLNESKVDWKSNGILGAKNLYPLDFNTIKDGHSSSVYEWNDRTVTTSNVAFTINEDGTVTVNTVGTVPSNISFSLGTYPIGNITDGCIASDGGVGVSGQYKLVLVFKSGSTYLGEVSVYDEELITLPSGCNRVDFTLVVYANTTVSNITFKPMIRLAADTDDTYEPYAKTNQELTDDNTRFQHDIEYLLSTGVKNIAPPFSNQYLDTTTSQNCTMTNNNGVYSFTATGNYGRKTIYYPQLLEVGKRYRFVLLKKFTTVNNVPCSIALRSVDNEYSDSRNIYFTNSAKSDDNFVEITYPFTAEHEDLYVMVYAQRGTGSGNKIEIKDFMIYDDSITSDTNYEPYAKGNQELTKETTGLIDNENILGAKNFLKQVIDNISIPNVGDIGDRASSANGLSFTYNDDGSITVNGTPTDSTLRVEIKLDWKTNSYKNNDISAIAGKDVIGSIVPIAVDGIQMRLGYFEANGTGYQSDAITTSLKYTLPQNAKYLRTYISISGAYSYNNVTLYPMVRLASDSDDTYVPYAKTNRELTNSVDGLQETVGSGAGYHNSIYRGKSLGNVVTDAQYAAISDGSFDGLFIGDYWTIGGVNYRIGAFDYWLKTGDTACNTHHVLLVPDSALANGKMNDTNTTAGGYAGSDLKTGANDNTALATARNTIISAFGSSHILSHREYFTKAVADGKPSSGGWYDSDIDLMNENMVYGTNIFLPHSDGSTVPNLYTIDKTQIKLFAERPDLIAIRVHWYLRDVVSAAYFAAITIDGGAFYSPASSSCGVRPAFAIIGA